MTTILLTGFEPFAGASRNPSWDAVSLIAARWSRPERLVAERLPVVFAEAGPRIAELVAEHSPDLVIATGLANGRSAITPERVAVNVEDARIPDNAGDRPTDRPIDPDGPVGIWSGLPVRAIVDTIAAEGIPAALSDSAGTYVCNSTMYRLLAATRASGIPAGFIHVPSSPELAAGTTDPSLPVDVIARALELAIEASLP